MQFFLLGFMGSGKSHWAKRWAARFQYDFYDLDDTIEAMEMMSIVDIFEQKGEIYFREKEAKLIRELKQFDKRIISCGGGTPCFHNNMEWMNNNGVTIYLSATPEYLLQHIMMETHKRPLVKEVNESELLYFITQKLQERAPIYSRAQITLDAATVTENTFGGILYAMNL